LALVIDAGQIEIGTMGKRDKNDGGCAVTK